MISPEGQESWRDIVVLAVIGVLATVVRHASSPPATVGRLAWLMVAGLGLATGGWLFAQVLGLRGWSAMAMAWCAGALGSEALLPVVRRWLEARAPRPPGA